MLSKTDRTFFLIATGAQESVTRWVEGDNKLTPDEKRLLRTGRTFMRKALTQMIERLVVEDPDGTVQLTKDAKAHSLTLEPSRTFIKNRVSIDKEDFEMLVGMVVGDCQERPEEWCRGNYKSCTLRKTLVACQVPYKNKEKGCRTCRYREKADE